MALGAALHHLTVLPLENQKEHAQNFGDAGFLTCRLPCWCWYSAFFSILAYIGPAVESLLQSPQKKNCSAEKRVALMLSGRNITSQVDSSKTCCCLICRQRAIRPNCVSFEPASVSNYMFSNQKVDHHRICISQFLKPHPQNTEDADAKLEATFVEKKNVFSASCWKKTNHIKKNVLCFFHSASTETSLHQKKTLTINFISHIFLFWPVFFLRYSVRLSQDHIFSQAWWTY